MTQIFACHLMHRGAVRIGGEDRRSFLQGLISNDIALCIPGTMLYAALLTPQGKFLHDLFLIDTGEDFLVDCEAARAEDLLKRLNTYKLRSKVTLENVVKDYEVWATMSAALQAAPFFADPRLPGFGLRAIVKKGTLTLPHVDFASYDKQRILSGLPDGSRDLQIEKSTLTEGNIDLLNGVSWSKGCYMGQELTARMHYRGLAKKRLFPVRVLGPTVMPQSVVTYRGEDIGDVRSARDDTALALLSIADVQVAIRDDEQFVCGDSKLEPFKPAWMKL